MDSPGEREIHGWISLALQAQQGETETDEGPVDLRPVERADHGRSALAFRAEQDCAAMKGEAQKAGARRKMCAGIFYSTLSPFFERDAVDAGTCFASLSCSARKSRVRRPWRTRLAGSASTGPAACSTSPAATRPHGKDCSYNPLAFPPSMEGRCGRYDCRDAGVRATQGAVAEDRVGSSDRVDSWWEMQASHYHPNARSSLAHAGPLSGFSQDDIAGQKHSRALPPT